MFMGLSKLGYLELSIIRLLLLKKKDNEAQKKG